MRDVVAMSEMDLGIKALGTSPFKTEKRGAGQVNVTKTMLNQIAEPGDYLYADWNGILMKETALDVALSENRHQTRRLAAILGSPAWHASKDFRLILISSTIRRIPRLLGFTFYLGCGNFVAFERETFGKLIANATQPTLRPII